MGILRPDAELMNHYHWVGQRVLGAGFEPPALPVFHLAECETW